MTDQPTGPFLSAFPTWRCYANPCASILAPLKMPHPTQCVGANRPSNAWSLRYMEPVPNGVGSAVKPGLPAAVAMILNPTTVTSIRHCAVVVVAEPGTVLER